MRDYGLTPALLQLVISGLFLTLTGILWWLIRRYAHLIDRHEEIIPGMIKSLEQITKNQYELYYSLTQTMTSLAELRGAHEAMTDSKLNTVREIPSCMERRKEGTRRKTTTPVPNV
jgi:hypothetical protein